MPNYFWALVLCVVSLFATTATASVSTNSVGFAKHSDTLYRVSQKTDVKMIDLVTMASIESTMGAGMKNKRSSAKGLFGFTDRTWRTTVKKYGKEYGVKPGTSVKNPRANTLMAVAYMKENKEFLERSLQRQVGINEIYMAHLLGPGGAVKILKARNDRLAVRVAGGAAGNRAFFYTEKGKPRTVAGFKQYVNTVVSNHRKAYKQEVTLYAFQNQLPITIADNHSHR